MDCVTLIRKADPSASSAAIAGWEWIPVASAFEAAFSDAGSATVTPGPPAPSITMALRLLRAHDGAEAAAGGGTHVVVWGRDQDRGRLAAHLAGRAGADERDLVAVLLPEKIDRVERAEALELRRRDELAALGRDHQDRQLVGLPGDVDGAQAELGKRPRGGSAGVGLLDAAGQWALAAHGQASAVGHHGPGEDTRRDDEDVARAEWVSLGIDFLIDYGRRQTVAAERLEIRTQRTPCYRATRQVDIEEVGHGRSHPFPGAERSPSLVLPLPGADHRVIWIYHSHDPSIMRPDAHRFNTGVHQAVGRSRPPPVSRQAGSVPGRSAGRWARRPSPSP